MPTRPQSFRLHLLAATSLLVVGTAGSLAKAADVPPNIVAIDTMEDIVVTAEKREISLQRAPLAITALSSSTLEQANIRQLSDLNTQVPGLTIAKNGGYTRVMAIRGIGFETSDNISSQPGTSFHIDGVYISGAYSLSMDLVDIERLEVLRGPQGTVFGQSATGGVINAITSRPSLDAVTGSAEAGVGTYNLYRAAASLNLPLAPTLAVRVVGNRNGHRGFARQTGLADYRLDDANRYTLKGQALWQPSDVFSLLLTGQHFDADEHGAAQKHIDDPNPDPREVTQDYPNKYRLTFTLASAAARLSLPWAEVKSLTSYQRMRNPNQVDNDRLDLASAGFYDNLKDWSNQIDAFSQELSLSAAPGSSVQWIAGIFYLYEKKHWDITEFVGTDANPVFIVPPTLPLNWPYNLDYTLDTTLRHRSYALFGQATVPVGDRLRVTAGGRYTRERMNNYTDTNHGMFGPPILQYPKFNPFTGKANVEFDLAKRNLLYASVSRGYKPGGVNYNSTPFFVGLTYRPEKVLAYEVGSKNRFFADRVTLNLAGFYYDYTDLQYQQEDPIPYQGGVSNIPKARIWGLEAEGSVAVTPALHLSANATVLDGKMPASYMALDPSAAHQATLTAAAQGYGPFDMHTILMRAQQVRNTQGNKPPKLPGFQGAVSIAYTADLSGDSLLLRADVEYRGKFNYRIFNDGVRDKVPSYTSVNLYAGYELGSNWLLALNVINLFDRSGVNSRYSNPFGRFTTSQEYIPPRQIMVTAKYSF